MCVPSGQLKTSTTTTSTTTVTATTTSVRPDRIQCFNNSLTLPSSDTCASVAATINGLSGIKDVVKYGGVLCDGAPDKMFLHTAANQACTLVVGVLNTLDGVEGVSCGKVTSVISQLQVSALCEATAERISELLALDDPFRTTTTLTSTTTTSTIGMVQSLPPPSPCVVL